jgi:hypothetical protein
VTRQRPPSQGSACATGAPQKAAATGGTFVLFVTIKMINKLKKHEEAKPVPAEVPADVELLNEIRDLLAQRLEAIT